MSTVTKSLSVVVPVHNAERHLSQRISRLLEVLPDLATKFEVLIVDDGSTDQTEDVALELAHRYPQVRVARHPEQRGIEASAQTGAAHTTGDVVVVHAGRQPVNAAQLHQLWRRRIDEDLVVAPVGSEIGGIDPEVLREVERWGLATTKEPPSRGVPNALPEVPRHAVQRQQTGKKASVPAPIFRLAAADNSCSMQR